MSSVAPRPAPLLFERCEGNGLDEVMAIMIRAFDPEYGEAWTRSQCAGILPLSGVAMTLARRGDNGAPVGFSLIRTVADEAELLLIAVDPAMRRNGIGRALIDHFVEHARNGGAIRLHLEVRDGNDAIGLYRGAGFVMAGRRQLYYRGASGRQYDALTLALRIAQV
ncbi:MAG: GNAT family N-acetyltransferase [Pseudomonadota bacterium]|nr:GNAT family N-acetyltransferase [Pseudomonadota bacterium]